MTEENEKPEYHLGHHELLHVTSIAHDFVDRHVLDHEHIDTDPEWKKLAGDASEALWLLYQAIGERARNDE